MILANKTSSKIRIHPLRRLGVYPTWILYSTTIEAPQIVEMFPAYYFFNGLLSVLLVSLRFLWDLVAS